MVVGLALFLLSLGATSAQNPPAPGLVDHVPGLGKPSTRNYAGHLQANASCGTFPFFWLAESKSDPANDPLIIWFNGGPGSSSLFGWFKEGGPYRHNDDCSVITENEWSWNKNATFMAIDQPAGTGLSFVEKSSCHAKTELQSTEQLFNALLDFMLKFPQYRHLPVYLFGESYAGKYITRIAARILEDEKHRINLQGIGLGNAFVSPLLQEKSYMEYAYTHDLIDQAQVRHANAKYEVCEQMVKNSSAAAADRVPSKASDDYCSSILDWICASAGNVSSEDVRKFASPEDPDDTCTTCPCVDPRQMRAALHVDPRVTKYKDKDEVTAELFGRGSQTDLMPVIPTLLRSIRVLVYNGVYDLNCNYIGADMWLAAMPWHGSAEWASLGRSPFLLRGTAVGHARRFLNLSQVTLQGAGHAAPLDQPERTWVMVSRFLNGEL